MRPSSDFKQLPSGWVRTTLGEIARLNPKEDLSALSGSFDVTFLPMRCVQEMTGQMDATQTRPLSAVKKGFTQFKNGDLLFAKITPCMENGKVAIARNLKNGLGFGSTEFHVIRLPGELPNRLWFYFLIREELRRDAKRNMTGSAGQLRVPARYLEQLPLPFPPLPEQKRIVAKIEELFSDLDAGVEALKRAKAEIKRYRQAVLKCAFESGFNTKTQRHQPGSEITPVVKLEECTRLITKGESPKWQGFDYVKEGVSFIRSENVLWGSVDASSAARIPQQFHDKLKRSQVKPRDVLVNLVGASIGRSGVVPDSVSAANVNQAVAVVRTSDSLIPPYLMYFVISPQTQKVIHSNKVETARANISLSDLREMQIPLPSVERQQQIVSEIERRFSVADEAEKVIDRSLKQAETLRQSVLKRAFEGKLVPQDPADPPAQLLLEQIRAERAKLALTGKAKRVRAVGSSKFKVQRPNK